MLMRCAAGHTVVAARAHQPAETSSAHTHLLHMLVAGKQQLPELLFVSRVQLHVGWLMMVCKKSRRGEGFFACKIFGGKPAPVGVVVFVLMRRISMVKPIFVWFSSGRKNYRCLPQPVKNNDGALRYGRRCRVARVSTSRVAQSITTPCDCRYSTACCVLHY